MPGTTHRGGRRSGRGVGAPAGAAPGPRPRRRAGRPACHHFFLAASWWSPPRRPGVSPSFSLWEGRSRHSKKLGAFETEALKISFVFCECGSKLLPRDRRRHRPDSPCPLRDPPLPRGGRGGFHGTQDTTPEWLFCVTQIFMVTQNSHSGVVSWVQWKPPRPLCDSQKAVPPSLLERGKGATKRACRQSSTTQAPTNEKE
jgi:hypothetical protein